MSRLACRCCGWLLLARNGGGYINFDQHAGMRKLVDIQEGMSWPWGTAERFGEALKIGAGRANIGNVGDDLNYVRHRGAVPRESSLDLVERVAALPGNVARIQNRTELTVLIFRADTG